MSIKIKLEASPNLSSKKIILDPSEMGLSDKEWDSLTDVQKRAHLYGFLSKIEQPCWEIDKFEQMTDKWISVKDALPEDNKEVLVFAPGCYIIGQKLIGCYFKDGDSWTVYDFLESSLDEVVTHWMPLPESPK